jgi:ubiquinone/menaquinone biosynthesis C-methylase UbiE
MATSKPPLSGTGILPVCSFLLDCSETHGLEARATISGNSFAQSNAERLPFADRTFDVVFHVGGINFFDQPAVAVREMVRVARAGGSS